MGVKTSHVRFHARKKTLKALVTRPRKAAGAVVLLHGLCVDRDEYDGLYVDLADALAAAGLMSIRFDFQGHGRRRKEWRKFSIVEQYVETCAAIDWLAETEDLQPNRIRIAGTSFGAPPAIFAAYGKADLVDRIALISPVLDYRATFLNPVCQWGRANFGQAAIAKAASEGKLVIDGGQHFPPRLFDEMELIDPLDRLSLVTAKTLIVHGASDSMVPVGPAREAARLPNVKLVEEREMDHGPFHRDDEEGDSPLSAKLRKRLIGNVTEHLSQGI